MATVEPRLPTNWEIRAFHVDLSDAGAIVQLPEGWMPLSVAEKNGNDLALVLYRERG